MIKLSKRKIWIWVIFEEKEGKIQNFVLQNPAESAILTLL
jgi:IS1 family transposase